MSQRLLVLVGSLIVAGCSTTNNTMVVEPKCGAGTVLVDGECVAAGDASVIDSNLVDSANAADTTTMDEGPKDTGFVPTDTPVDTTVAGDPCPTKPALVNCSTTCAGGGTTMLNCSKAKCGTPFADTLRVKETEMPFVLRTPSNPGKDPACPACFAGTGFYYAMFIRTTFLGGSYFRATVAPPWEFYQHGGADIFCPDKALGQCLVAGSQDIVVGTRDPNAVSRNVVFESVPFGTTCP